MSRRSRRVYAVGDDHPLADPCRALIGRIGDGRTRATTTVEALQEFVHVRARRRGREDAARLARRFATLLDPLLQLQRTDLDDGLELFTRHEGLGAFDAVLAAASKRAGAVALVSADRAFTELDAVSVLDPGAPGFLELVAEAGR